MCPHGGGWVTWLWGLAELSLRYQPHESPLSRARKPSTTWLGDVERFLRIWWKVLSLDLAGGCSLLSILTPHPTQSIVVYSLCLHRHTLCSHRHPPRGSPLVWGQHLGSAVDSPTTLCRRPSFQAEAEVLESRMPHSGEGGGQGLLRPSRHLPAVIHLVLAETGELLGGEAAS